MEFHPRAFITCAAVAAASAWESAFENMYLPYAAGHGVLLNFEYQSLLFALAGQAIYPSFLIVLLLLVGRSVDLASNPLGILLSTLAGAAVGYLGGGALGIGIGVLLLGSWQYSLVSISAYEFYPFATLTTGFSAFGMITLSYFALGKGRERPDPETVIAGPEPQPGR